MEHFAEGLSEGIELLLHELSVLGAFGNERFAITNYTFFLLIGFLLTLTFFIVAARRVSLVPRGIGNVAEAGVEFVRNNIVVDVMGEEGKRYFPFVATVFFFILFNNILGLIPGFLPGTGTMGVTATWALMVFLVYTGIGIRKHGVLKYLASFAPHGVPKPLLPFVWLLEFMGNLLRPLTLSVRLFANMFAGHIVLGIFALFTVLFFEAAPVFKIGLVLPLAFQIIMYAFEVFVAFIQAYVFAILTSVYIGGALHAGEH